MATTTSAMATSLPYTSPGSVLEFVAESVGMTWVVLRWSVSEVRDDLAKYSVLTNNDFKEEVRVSDKLDCSVFL